MNYRCDDCKDYCRLTTTARPRCCVKQRWNATWKEVTPPRITPKAPREAVERASTPDVTPIPSADVMSEKLKPETGFVGDGKVGGDHAVIDRKWNWDCDWDWAAKKNDDVGEQ